MKTVTIEWDHNRKVVWKLTQDRRNAHKQCPINFYKNGVLYDRLPLKDAGRIFIKAKLYAHRVKGTL